MTTSSEHAKNATAALHQVLHVSPGDFDVEGAAAVIDQAIRNATRERDIRASQQLMEAQAAAQERLARLLSASPAVIYSFKATADFAPTFIGDNITSVFGYTPADYLSDPAFWRDRVHPSDLVRVEEAISAFFHNGIHAVEYRFRHKDGSYRWVNDLQRLIRGVDGKPFEIVGSWSDITARKAAEQEKAAAHVRLNQLLMSSPAVIYSYRATGDFVPTFVSQNIKDWLGYEPREYLESADFWRSRVHPDEIAAVEAESGQLFKKGRHTVEYRFLKKDGSYCWVSDAQQLVRDEKGQPIEVVGSWSDITQLSHSISELRALEEVSQAVNSTLDLETVLTTIVAKAVQLSETEAGAIYVFDEVRREFHLRATYGMDQALIDALARQHIGLDDPNIKLALAHPEPIQVADLREGAPSAVNEVILRAGFRALLVAPLLRGENIVGVLVVRRRTPGVFPQNIVDLIQTFAAQSAVAIQNARLFREIDDKGRQLEVAGQHKSQFLANMSHELRTPLNAIIGYSEILQEDAANLGQEGLVRDLKKIESSGRHLLGLINDILDLSKVKAGRMDIFLEDVEIVPLLEEVRAIIVPLAEAKGNVLEFGLAENLGSIRTDRTKLKQSLLNILSNGCKFTENGRLTLVAERFETDRLMVRFAISDTGIGMTEEQLGRLFQAFSQADASTSKKYGGTGLGLAISQRFCKLLGGDIWVKSQPAEGSTFTITLPDQTETSAQIKPADGPHISGDANSATTVLLVDDDPTARDLLTASLKGAGYRLVHATNGAEALNLARTIRPDAITLDVIMPTTDGWEVLSALKADADLCEIPVVMVTIVPDRGIGLSLGAVDVLTKPVDRARLTALMHRLLRREGSVLLVEDDADTRDMMRHTIEKMGLPVAEAANGRAALTWLGDHPAPSMILLDLIMPEMSGFEVLRRLKAAEHTSHIPVIVISALDELDSVVHCIEAGAEDYLTKPFNPILLRARTGASLEKKWLRDREKKFVTDLEQEKARSETLLLNILPLSIVNRMRNGEMVIADSVAEATILFCDLVGFTTLSAELTGGRTVDFLSRIFSAFDGLATEHGVEKIKTIGDAYMAAAGIPEAQSDHADRIGALAPRMLDAVSAIAEAAELKLQARIGIHTGPVTAGVIGTHKFVYDVWGDTVNTASRMESHSLPGRIQVSAATRAALGDRFKLERRGMIEIKGKGIMETYFFNK